MPRVLVVCLNPTFQRTMIFDSYKEGEVNRAKQVFFEASGKGVNVSRVLSQKGSFNLLLTHIGYNSTEEMIKLCEKDNINLLYTVAKNTRNRTCTTLLNKDSITELVEEPDSVEEADVVRIMSLFNDNIDYCDALIISGTKSPGYYKELYPYFVKKAKELNKFVLLDLKGEDLINSIKYSPDVIKPNLSEFVKTFFNENISECEFSDKYKVRVIEKMKELYEKNGIKCIITAATNPVWSYSDNNFKEFEIIKSIKVVNTIGCGDTFSASLTHNIINNNSFEESIKAAIQDSAKNAENIKPGNIL
ncbi:MAG: bifunctional hydroxymethylpyrimidine kinase/phosphomethylpyrimidine kinase [Spirochaetaceae bacterium]|nr:bifunctional hydroxymethylpyrimidine kinase/phosphomethylpyrimidine kinase [Spirochaetaceae bacterium]